MTVPQILIIVPPPIESPKGLIAAKFAGAREKMAGLAEACRKVAQELRCDFLDAGTVTPSSLVDGVHLDADQHLKLGREIAGIVGQMLPGTSI